jgi:serine/threonine protein phosphatase PrpC
MSSLGDSRCVLCADGVAVDLSNDHKASSTQEKARVEEAGGRVINKRIMGNIAVSRAFGDFVMKLPEAPAYWGEEITADLVSPVPEILERGLIGERPLECVVYWNILTD